MFSHYSRHERLRAGQGRGRGRGRGRAASSRGAGAGAGAGGAGGAGARAAATATPPPPPPPRAQTKRRSGLARQLLGTEPAPAARSWQPPALPPSLPASPLRAPPPAAHSHFPPLRRRAAFGQRRAGTPRPGAALPGGGARGRGRLGGGRAGPSRTSRSWGHPWPARATHSPTPPGPGGPGLPSPRELGIPLGHLVLPRVATDWGDGLSSRAP